VPAAADIPAQHVEQQEDGRDTREADDDEPERELPAH
jgi:hypothetical protein